MIDLEKLRELEVWPDGVSELIQWKHRGLTDDRGFEIRIILSMLAADWESAYVDRPQWQAERDRMKAMGTQQATASTEPTYEQQLWDRVAQSTLASMLGDIGGADFFVDDACTQKAVSSADFASCAADYADVFMAERAKRVGK